VFISYSRADGRFVDRLDTELERRGFRVWLDRSDIDGGSAWRGEIAQAIRDCETFLLVFSPRAAESIDVAKELALADKYGKPILPVVLERHPIPDSMAYQLAGLQQIRISNTFFSAGFQRLLEALPAPDGLSSTPVEKNPLIRSVGKSMKNWSGSCRLVTFVSVLAVLCLATWLTFRFLPSGSASESYSDTHLQNQDPGNPSHTGNLAVAADNHDLKGEPGSSAVTDLRMRSHIRSGVYTMDIPSDWRYVDLSDFDKTFERYADPSNSRWLDIEIASFGFGAPDEVLGAFVSGWQSDGKVFVEKERRMEAGGWLIRGTISDTARGLTYRLSLLMSSEGVVNGNLVLYSLLEDDAIDHEVLFEKLRSSFQLLPAPAR
jgi:hypothetical protein